MNKTQTASALLSPVSPGERIISLDVLRGLAVMGIFLVNIQSFSMLFMNLANPTVYGDFTGLNRLVYLFIYTFAQQKFLALFSLLFGAGVLLMSRNIESRGGKPAGLHYRRMLWLILIGLLHAYVLWYGDILVGYGLCGLWVYLMRKRSAKTLFIVGIILLLIGTAIVLLAQWTMPNWPPELIKQSALSWQPDQALTAAEINAYRGGWTEQLSHRIPATIGLQLPIFFLVTLWRVSGMMLLGMALLKWGVFKNRDIYKKLMIIGFGAGMALHIAGWSFNMRHHWVFEKSMFQGAMFVSVGSLFMAMAYLGVILWLCRAGTLNAVTRPLAAMGRLAFTNYLMQTVICTFIFYGHGLGLFGKVSRLGQMGIVIVILAFQLWFSTFWLKHFRFGPVEWLWRSLTYRKRQPFRKTPPQQKV